MKPTAKATVKALAQQARSSAAFTTLALIMPRRGDHATRNQGIDFTLFEAKLDQHLAAMFTEFRRESAQGSRRSTELNRRTQRLVPLFLYNHLSMCRVRMRYHLRGIVNRPRG